jgi:hypothetical protein
MKVPLFPLRRHSDPKQFGFEKMLVLKESLPFYEREGAGYVHRVRDVTVHYKGEKSQSKISHVSVQFWCGACGFTGPKRGRSAAAIVETPSNNRPVCATCEGRAIGSGQLGSREIAGREVSFRPQGRRQ